VLAGEVAMARRRHRVSDALVLYRRADHPGDDVPWQRLRRQVPGVEILRDQDGFVLVRLPLPPQP
jgi:hypothetical protein